MWMKTLGNDPFIYFIFQMLLPRCETFLRGKWAYSNNNANQYACAFGSYSLWNVNSDYNGGKVP